MPLAPQFKALPSKIMIEDMLKRVPESIFRRVVSAIILALGVVMLLGIGR